MVEDAGLAPPGGLPAARRAALERLEANNSAWRLVLRGGSPNAAPEASTGPDNLSSMGDVLYRECLRFPARARKNLAELTELTLPKGGGVLEFAVLLPGDSLKILPTWASAKTGQWGGLALADSIRVGRWLLDQSSRHFLLHARYGRFNVTRARLSYFSCFVASNGYRHDQVLLDASIVLELYGLRRAQRLDYLALEPERVSRPCIHRNDGELIHHGASCQALLEDPDRHFQLGELRYVSFSQLERFKRSRRHDVDDYDLGMMRALETNNRAALLWHRGRYELSLAVRRARRGIRRLARRLFGKQLAELYHRRHNRRSH
ncbi:hypothetical protein LY622_04810 [Halomonas sp. M5N1S17]|uniref:hypothetical protein n=1 Tax=Halomonas alkalisoli TaxID=2907158 RepID=UPI001F17C2D8|nr:hypothetical protein [Halomonas alkalisoli]MCE9662754.1 hypothetical protein [Halomonas alkalisoli]